MAWVAALRQVKRPDLLIEIANRLPSTRFVVCGGPTTFRSPRGYDTQIVSALKAVPNIDYQGQVAPDDVQGIIRNAALFLSTADEEGFPNTFLEAWLAGTPVVSLKIDPDQVIRRFGLGVVSTGVENAVADICALLNAPSKREMIGSRARQYVTAVHREKAVVSIFERAITGRSSTQTEDHDRSHPLLTPAGLPAMDSMKGK